MRSEKLHTRRDGSTASRRIGNLAFLKRPIHQWGPPPREGATYATVQGLNYTRRFFPFALSHWK